MGRLAVMDDSANTSQLPATGITVNDSTGRFLLVNRGFCEITGYTERELACRKFQSITHPDDLSANLRLRESMRAGEIGSMVCEERYIRKDSRIIRVRNSVSLMRDGCGNVVFFASLSEPISAAGGAQVGSGFRLISKVACLSEEEERRRIARDLHDSTGQLLSGLVMNLTRLEAGSCEPPERDQLLREAVDLAGQCSREVRTFSYLLHPPLVDEFGLVCALQSFTEGFRHRTGIRLRLAVSDDFGRLPRNIELTIFRVVQEALTNIHRHSRSPVATITLERLAGKVVLEVADCGRGLRGRSAGLGLAGMRERARELGGSLIITSGREGTRILLSVPHSDCHEEDTHPHRR